MLGAEGVGPKRQQRWWSCGPKKESEGGQPLKGTPKGFKMAGFKRIGKKKKTHQDLKGKKPKGWAASGG